MRIVVLGAGTVGRSIASLLCLHRHSVTVVDTNADRIRHINENFDVRGITGSASQSSILFQAGVGSADLCLAVTGYDEVNIVSASMAKAMGANRAVARVYAPVFRDLSTFRLPSTFWYRPLAEPRTSHGPGIGPRHSPPRLGGCRKPGTRRTRSPRGDGLEGKEGGWQGPQGFGAEQECANRFDQPRRQDMDCWCGRQDSAW